MSTDPEPSSGPVVIRSEVADKAPYTEYRDDLRLDFWFSCAYCTITEIEAQGISFEIDHYVPASEDKTDPLLQAYANLMYACRHCNELKSDLESPAEAQEIGQRFFRPDEDDPREHFELDDLRVNGRSPVGTFTEIMLDLNRQSLRRLRGIRQDLAETADQILHGLRILAGIKAERLPAHMRAQFERARLTLQQEGSGIGARLDDIALQSMGSSDLLDADPGRDEQRKVRRSYLEVQKAAYPGKWRGRTKSKSDGG